MADRIGIAVSTYQRRDHLTRAVDLVESLTQSPFELVVADDGSDDGTVEWCRSRGVRVICGSNRGVAWNKNRGLFALSLLGCDPLILMEDDVYPAVAGWEQEWVQATRRWHHIGYLHPKIAADTLGGAGTPEDPFVNPKATAQCLAVSAEVLAKVGFFDSRFHGWGHEHAEWTSRIKRAGYGTREIGLLAGGSAQGLIYIGGGLIADDGTSYRNNAQAEANMATYRRISREVGFRYPWVDEAERVTFLSEQIGAGLGELIRDPMLQ